MMKKINKKLLLIGLMLNVGASIYSASLEEMNWMKKNGGTLNSRADFIEAQQAYVNTNAVIAGSLPAPEESDELATISPDRLQPENALSMASLHDFSLDDALSMVLFGGLLPEDTLSIISPDELSPEIVKSTFENKPVKFNSPRLSDEAIAHIASSFNQPKNEKSYETITFNGFYLPDELIAHIISFLDTRSFGKSALICKHLKDVRDHIPTSQKIEKLLKIGESDKKGTFEKEKNKKKPLEKEEKALKIAIKHDAAWALKHILNTIYNQLIHSNSLISDKVAQKRIFQRLALQQSIESENQKITQLLVEQYGIHPDVNFILNRTLLFDSCCDPSTDNSVKILLELGAYPSVVAGVRQVSALHAAADQNYVEKVRLLCTHGASVLAKTGVDSSHTRCNVIVAACENGNLEIVKILITRLREQLGCLAIEEKMEVDSQTGDLTKNKLKYIKKELEMNKIHGIEDPNHIESEKDGFFPEHTIFDHEYCREDFANIINEGLERARATNHADIVAFLQQALEDGLPNPAQPEPINDAPAPEQEQVLNAQPQIQTPSEQALALDTQSQIQVSPEQAQVSTSIQIPEPAQEQAPDLNLEQESNTLSCKSNESGELTQATNPDVVLHRQEAAALIESACRGELERRKQAAISIQAACRGLLERQKNI